MASGDQVASVRPGRIICVLGMHCSGTSALTGSLQRHGLFVGVRGGQNATHFLRENFAIVGIHNDILRGSGGSWDAPPERVEWLDRHFDRAREILAAFASHPVWGFKDPRTLLTFEGWQQLLPDIEPVGIIRHPLRVARSLLARGWGPEPRGIEATLGAGIELWQRYNSRLLSIHRERPFPIISFDEEPAVFEAKLRQLAELLRLDPTPSGDPPFFRKEKRRSEAAAGPLPAEAERLHRELAALAI